MPNPELEVLRQLAATNTWLAIYPEVALGLLALVVLTLELFLPKRLRGLLPGWALLGQTLLLAVLIADFSGGGRLASLSEIGATSFGGLIQHTSTGNLFRVFFLLASILVTYLVTVAFRHQREPRVEFVHINLVATAAMMLLAQSNHFVLLFVALETVTVCLYVLVSYFRSQTSSLEAGLKYLVMGGLSSGLLLFGIVLLYGAGGTPGLEGSVQQPMNFDQLAQFIGSQPSHPLVLAGVALVLAGIFFKIGAFPFQLWIPDVYQGAPTPTTALLAIASKGAGIAVLVILVSGPFAPLSDLLTKVLAATAAGSILFGNFAALTQRNVKRLIGLSGVSHAGFLLMGVAAFTALHEGPGVLTEQQAAALGAVVIYLAGYLFASAGVFSVMAHLTRKDDAVQELEHYDELAKKQPLLAGSLAVGLGSLAGIPPTAGFIGKALIFIAAVQAGLGWLVAVAIVGVVVSIYYYFGWMKAAFFETWKLPPVSGVAPVEEPVLAPDFAGRIFLVGTAAATLLLGILQWPVSIAVTLW